MNIRFTVLLVVILVVIGGTVWITQTGRTPERTEDVPWLWKVELDDITRIAVTHEGVSLSYGLRGEQWVIEDGNDTPVFQDKWGGMTLTVSGPRPARTLSEVIEDPGLYGLAPPKTVVQVTDRSGRQVRFDLGAATPDALNQYIRLADGSLSTVPKIWGDVVSTLVTEPPYSPPFISTLGMDQIKEMAITTQGQTTVYLLIEEGDWILLEGDGILVQEDRWQELVASLGEPDLEAEADEIEDLSEFGLDDPAIILDVAPNRGDQVKFLVGDLDPGSGRRYFKQFGQDDLYTVGSEWADLLVDMATDPPVADTPADAGSGTG